MARDATRNPDPFFLADQSSMLRELSKVQLRIVRLYFREENRAEEQALLQAFDGRLR